MSPAVLPLLAALPLLLAGATVLRPASVLARALMVAVPAATALAGLLLVGAHRTTPVLVEHVGAFLPGVAISFVSDTLTAVMLVLTGLTTAVCAWFLLATGEARRRFLPSLVLMLTGGVNGALLTGDLFNLFVFVEVMLLPSYALVGITGTWARLGAARTFVLVNLVTSTILLVGIGFVYGVTGTVSLAALAGRGHDDPRTALAVAVVLTALGIKSGVVPAHGWLPRTYPATSAGVMALFSGLHTKVALYAVYRLYVVLFDGRPAPWATVVAGLAVVTMLVGALASTAQGTLRTVLAFQMVAGIGHILLGVVVLTPAALAAGLLYLAHHVVTTAALLLAVGALEHVYGTGRLPRLTGMMSRERALALVVGVGLFSLVGLPPTSGLWGKAGLVLALPGGPWPALTVGTLVVASLVSLLALQRLWRDVFAGPPMERYRPDDLRTGRGELTDLTPDVRITPALLAPAAVMAALSVAVFLAPGPVTQVLGDAAAALRDVRAYATAVGAR